MNAVAACGLQLYRFGQAVSLCFWTDTWRPDSFYDRVATNARDGLHTLCLLDIKVKEPSEESLARGKPVYLPPRFMTANQAARQLLQVEQQRGQHGTWEASGGREKPHVVAGGAHAHPFTWQPTAQAPCAWRWRAWGRTTSASCAPRLPRWLRRWSRRATTATRD